MKSKNSQWIEDVEELLQKSTIAEASDSVWEKFSKAMNELDENSQSLLEQFFSGKTIPELAKQNHIPEKELEDCLKRAKRELTNQLRAGFLVRQ